MVKVIFRLKKKQMSDVEKTSENSENKISSTMINDILIDKDHTKPKIIFDENISTDLLKLHTKHRVLESKLKDLENKIQAIMMTALDGDEIKQK